MSGVVQGPVRCSAASSSSWERLDLGFLAEGRRLHWAWEIFGGANVLKSTHSILIKY